MRTSAKGEGAWSNADTCGQRGGGMKRGHFCGHPLWTTPKWYSWAGTHRNAVPALFPRRSSFCSNYDGIIGLTYSIAGLSLYICSLTDSVSAIVFNYFYSSLLDLCDKNYNNFQYILTIVGYHCARKNSSKDFALNSS